MLIEGALKHRIYYSNKKLDLFYSPETLSNLMKQNAKSDQDNQNWPEWKPDVPPPTVITEPYDPPRQDQHS